MIKIMKRFISLALIALVVFSCDKRESEQLPILDGCGTAISISDIAFSPMPDDYEFAISSVSPYVIKGIPSWATLKYYDSTFGDYREATTEKDADGTEYYSSAVGTKNYLIVVEYNKEEQPENFTPGDSRKALLTIESEDASIMESVKLTQEYAYLIIEAEGLDEEQNIPTEKVEVRPKDSRNFTWNYTEKAPFNSNALKFSIKCNTDLSISYNAVRSNETDDITGSILNNVYSSVRADGDSTYGGWLVGPKQMTYQQNKDYSFEWEFVPESWNTTRDKRKINVTISNPNDRTRHSYEIAFSQNNVRFLANDSVSPNGLEYASCYTSPQTITIDSEMEWSVEVENGKDWISLDPTNPTGMTNGQFTVDMNHANCTEGANAVSEQSVGSITIWGYVAKNSTADKISMNIPISQAPYIFNVLDSREENDVTNFQLKNTKNTENFINVQSSGDWEISSNDEWVSLSENGGKGSQGNANVESESVKISTNDYNYNTQEDRSTIVTAKSKLNTMKRDIEITQPKYTFVSTANDVNLTTFDVEEHTIEVRSSGAWRIDENYEGSANGNESWLEFSQKSGVGAEGGEESAIVRYWAKTGNEHAADRKAAITVVSVPHEEKNLANGVNIKHDIVQSKYIFEVSMDNAAPEFTAIPIATQYTLDIKCSDAWTVEAPNWIEVSRSGVRDAKLSVKAQYNYSYEPRDSVIVVKSFYEPTGTQHTSQVYRVTQHGFIFNVEPTTVVSVPAFIRNEKYDISVQSSTEWNVIQDSDYNEYIANVTPLTGTRDVKATTSVTVKSNPDLTPREFSMSIETGGSEPNEKFVKSVLFKQEAYEFDSTSETHSYAALNEEMLTLDVKCSGDWVLENRPSWFKVISSTGQGGEYFGNDRGSGDVTLVFKTDNNYELTPSPLRQSDNFVLRSTLNDLTRPIEISQNAFKFDIAPTTLNQFASVGGTESHTLAAYDGAINVASKPEWIESVSINDKTVTIKATPNTSLVEARTGVIRLESEYYSQNNNLYKEITVSQAAFKFDNEPTTLTFGGNSDNKSVKLGVCDGEWKIEKSASWVTVTPTSGTGGSIDLTISVAANNTTQQRPATVKVVSKLDPKLYKEIQISQDAYLVVSPITVNAPVSGGTHTISVKCASNWAYEMDAMVDWITITQDANGAKLTIAANTTGSPKRATIKIVSTGSVKVAQDVVVNQAEK